MPAPSWPAGVYPPTASAFFPTRIQLSASSSAPPESSRGRRPRQDRQSSRPRSPTPPGRPPPPAARSPSPRLKTRARLIVSDQTFDLFQCHGHGGGHPALHVLLQIFLPRF